jgi:hypothetical protein
MNSINVHSTFAVLAPLLAGSKYFYQLFYYLFAAAGDLVASGLSKEVTP